MELHLVKCLEDAITEVLYNENGRTSAQDKTRRMIFQVSCRIESIIGKYFVLFSIKCSNLTLLVIKSKPRSTYFANIIYIFFFRSEISPEHYVWIHSSKILQV